MLKPSQIEARVRDLLLKHKVTEPPVPVQEIAHHLGAIIRKAPYEGDMSGALYRSEDKPVIGINTRDAPVRRRFTIAHEIGHLCLHADPLHLDPLHNLGVIPNPTGTRPTLQFLRNRVSSEASDPHEIEANRFAAALLMPSDFLARDLTKLAVPITESDIDELARSYKVSYQAMTFRLMNLGVPMETV